MRQPKSPVKPIEPAKLLGRTFFLIALVAASNAGAVQRRDARDLDALYKRSLDLTQALTDSAAHGVSQLNATGDAQALDCLDTLREASNQVSDQLMDVADVAGVAAVMRHPADRRAGSSLTARALTRALGILPIEARQINQTAGLCLTQTLVQNKARDQLTLINDATAKLTQLQAKLDPRAIRKP